MQDPAQTIDKILDIIGYSDDKEEFVEKFFNKCETAAVLKLVNELPEDKRKEVENKVKSGNFDNLLDKYVDKENYRRTLTEAAELALTDYLTELAPLLSQSQKNQIQSLLQTV